MMKCPKNGCNGEINEKRTRHDWEFIKQLECNKLYRCRNCGEQMQGNLELALCPQNCQHEIHFCNNKEANFDFCGECGCTVPREK